MSLMQLHRTCWRHDRPFKRQRNPGVALRTYRAISWLECASAREHDVHATFVFLWIAFNAAYGAGNAAEKEVERQRAFFRRILAADGDAVLPATLRQSRRLVETVLESRQIYWRRIRNQEGDRAHGDWHVHFRRDTNDAMRALDLASPSGSATVLDAVFDRLSTLRNLLMHGQVSWRSRIAGPVVETASDFLATMVPVFVRLMIEHRDADWELPSAYPDIHRGEHIEPKA